jgi:uncharacterized membrane protein
MDTEDAIMKKWRCTVCGYVHQGEEPPDECPVCGADKSQFELIEENEGIAPDAAEATDVPARDEPVDTDRTGTASPAASRLGTYGQLLTRLHGHPIAVHIPNGLLPVAFFFIFMALLLGSESFAVAAKYNIIVVALAMPAVIGTGLIDWKNRYGGRMSRVFLVKMICAGIVTFLSFILAIWWIVHPTLHAGGFAANSLFLLLNLANLAAAAVAGWYGGKLVFNK